MENSNADVVVADVYNEKQFEMYETLIEEETDEFFDSDTRENTIKELLDIIVVSIGALHSLGCTPELAWDEVGKSNNSKIDPETGKVVRREDGKILKGDNYIAPNFKKF